jgi:hypothetical protein
MTKAQFSRTTLLEACNLLGQHLSYHGQYDDLMLQWELDTLADDREGTIRQRFRNLFIYLRDHPDAAHDGRFVMDLVVEEATRYVTQRQYSREFMRALDRDGFVIDENHMLRRALPETLDLPATDDEVHVSLKRFNMKTSLGHLDQAIRNHTQGHWAAANGQLRTVAKLVPDTPPTLSPETTVSGVACFRFRTSV